MYSPKFVYTLQRFKACQQGQYQCKGGQCISPLFVCDGKKDCPSEDDEEDCGECSTDGEFKDCIAAVSRSVVGFRACLLNILTSLYTDLLFQQNPSACVCLAITSVSLGSVWRLAEYVTGCLTVATDQTRDPDVVSFFFFLLKFLLVFLLSFQGFMCSNLCVQTKPAVMACVVRTVSSPLEDHTVTASRVTFSWTTTPRVKVGKSTFMFVLLFNHVEGAN